MLRYRAVDRCWCDGDRRWSGGRSGAGRVRSRVLAHDARSISDGRRQTRSGRRSARRRVPSDRERDQRAAWQRRVEDGHRARQSAAALSRYGRGPGGVLRDGGRGQQHRRRDRSRAGRESAAHRGGMVPRTRERSRPQRCAAAGKAAGQSAQSGIPGAEPAARARRPARQACGPRHARAHRRELLRRDHVARRIDRADACGMRSSRERHARAGRPVPAADCARHSASRTGSAAGTAGRARRAAATTTACRACRTSTARWSSRAGLRSWTKKHKWLSPTRSSSVVPGRRHPGMSSASGS